MNVFGFLLFATAALAAPQGYDLGAPNGAGLATGPGGPGSSGDALHGGEGPVGGCRDGEVLHADGTCVVPEITRKVFVFDAPAVERPVAPLPSLPPPAVDHNILFVRLPEEGPGPDPIVIPPPRQNNVVYVLNKQEEQVQRVIEVPAQPQDDPEIYFVNYQEGQNPSLPLGVDLETALAAASAAGGQVLGGAGGEGGLEGALGGLGGGAGVAVGQNGFDGGVGVAGGQNGFSGGVGVAGGQNGFGNGVGVAGGGQNGFGNGVGVAGGHGGNGFGVVNGGGFGVNGGVGLGANGGVGSRPSGIYNTP